MTAWTVYHDGFSIADADGHIVSTNVEGVTEEEARANAALIVKAVNERDELIEVLDAARECIALTVGDRRGILQRIETVLRRARGEQP